MLTSSSISSFFIFFSGSVLFFGIIFEVKAVVGFYLISESLLLHLDETEL